MKKYFWPLLCLTLVTLVFGTIFAASQQVLRLSANDPQIQMAQDAANKLNLGANPASVITPKTDLLSSSAPFVMVYDKQGNIAATSAYAMDKPLRSVPFGVLKASGQTYNAVTWQPDYNIRIAAVSVEADQYYVLSGRSLHEVENRINQVFKTVALGWMAAVIIILAAYFLPKYLVIKNLTLNKK